MSIFPIELTTKRVFGPEIDENKIQNCKPLEKKHLKQSFPGFFAAVNKSITSVKSILWTMSCSVFRRAKFYILSCAMEERKTDLILFIWLKLRSHVTVEFFNISH